jgi:hypothetical protein
MVSPAYDCFNADVQGCNRWEIMTNTPNMLRFEHCGDAIMTQSRDKQKDFKGSRCMLLQMSKLKMGKSV